MKKELKHIVISAAGTGGHIVPGIAMADEMKRRGVAVSWIGGRRPLEKKMVQAAGLDFLDVQMELLRGGKLKQRLLWPFSLLRASIQAMRYLRRLKADAVIAFGGYVTVPVGIAAFILRVPLFLHEQNAICGLSNRYLSYLSTGVFTAFKGSFSSRSSTNSPTSSLVRSPTKASKKIMQVGNPLPQSIIEGREKVVLSDDKKVVLNDSRHEDSKIFPLRILICGGSQGARFLNKTMPPLMLQLAQQIPLSICHQTGNHELQQVRSAYEKKQGTERLQTLQVHAFIESMAEAYLQADVVICRAGAMTVSEIAAMGRAAIFIPYPFAAGNHQWYNADYLAKAGAAYIIEQRDFQSKLLLKTLEDFSQQPQLLQQMMTASYQRGDTDACSKMTQQLSRFFYF